MTVASRIARRLPFRPRDGVVGLVLTPAGRIVLVRHTYLDGWYPPGGGRKRGETPKQAVLRELHEEIGLSTWRAIEPLAIEDARVCAFVVHDAAYRPRRNLEIDAVAEFDLDALPADASPRLVRLLERFRGRWNHPPARKLRQTKEN